MSANTIPFRKLEKQTRDVYEAVIVIGKRARQITNDRYIIQEELNREEESLEEIGGEEEFEPPELDLENFDKEQFESQDKPVTQALTEFLDGKITWRYAETTDNGEE